MRKNKEGGGLGEKIGISIGLVLLALWIPYQLMDLSDDGELNFSVFS